VAAIDGAPRCDVVELALTSLARLEHRGGLGAGGQASDGAASLNADTMVAEPVSLGDDEALQELLRAHLALTGSAGAKTILSGRLPLPTRFVKVRARGDF
jgi:Glutamine amidotransferases class-II